MSEGLLALLRLAHGLTAAVWLGVSLVAVWSPDALAEARRRMGFSLRGLAQTSLWALVLTGAILTLDRLADPSISGLYIAVLALKLALVAAIALLGRVPPAVDATGWRGWLAAPRRDRTLLALGFGAYALGSLLTSVYEVILRGG
jgi:xanthine/uracil permease